jgi:cob(I)alamin adenosyltransferase
MHITGTVDEAQAALGMARAESVAGSELDEVLTHLERDLYVLMAEIATDPSNRSKLVAGKSLVTEEMVTALEVSIDDLISRVAMPTDFVIPGANRASAALDFSRTVVRRAERLLVSSPIEGSLVHPYLNRLSDLLWALARWAEGQDHLLARGAPRRARRSDEPGGSDGSGGSDGPDGPDGSGDSGGSVAGRSG